MEAGAAAEAATKPRVSSRGDDALGRTQQQTQQRQRKLQQRQQQQRPDDECPAPGEITALLIRRAMALQQAGKTKTSPMPKGGRVNTHTRYFNADHG